jgi:cytochrome c oxidase subunit 4
MEATSFRRSYVWTYVALMVLLVATVGVSELPLGRASMPVGLAIALVKTLLVVLFFMQLVRRGPLTRLFAACGFVWLGLAFFLTFVDYVSRGGWSERGHSWSSVEVSPDTPLPRAEH